MDLDGAVWHGNANCLTHFCEQVCDASAVTVIDQTSPACVSGCSFPNRCSDTRLRRVYCQILRIELEYSVLASTNSREYPSSSASEEARNRHS